MQMGGNLGRSLGIPGVCGDFDLLAHAMDGLELLRRRQEMEESRRGGLLLGLREVRE